MSRKKCWLSISTASPETGQGAVTGEGSRTILPSGDSGNVWMHLCLPQLWEGHYCILVDRSQAAAKYLIMHRTAPHFPLPIKNYPAQNVNGARLRIPDLVNKDVQLLKAPVHQAPLTYIEWLLSPLPNKFFLYSFLSFSLLSRKSKHMLYLTSQFWFTSPSQLISWLTLVHEHTIFFSFCWHCIHSLSLKELQCFLFCLRCQS